MQTDDVIIRAQVMGGTWEVFGADRAINVVPESVTLSSNEWGNDKASFDLRRDPAAVWPDLFYATPVEVEIGGVVIWTGRILETPARDEGDPVINVQAEGWQYHLDDDVYAQSYIHTRLSDWRDIRTFPDANLVTYFLSRFDVSSTEGAITIGARRGTVWDVGTMVGITLDLGPVARAKRVVIVPKRGPGNPNINLYCRGHDLPDGAPAPGSTVEDFFVTAAPLATGVTGVPLTGTVATPRRYVTIFLYNPSANGTYTTGADDTVTLTSITVYGLEDYYPVVGISPGLTADYVVKDAKKVAPLLSTDTSRIVGHGGLPGDVAFQIPDLHFENDPKSPREVISGVNAFHNYLTQVDVDRRLVFSPRPTGPLFEIGSFPGSTFEDSSMNSGQDVYNRVLVTGSAADGSPFIIERAAAGQPGAVLVGVSSPSFPNPTAAVDASSWTGMTRDTSFYQTSPASFKAATNVAATTTLSGTFLAGSTYAVQFAAAKDANAGAALVEISGSGSNNKASLWISPGAAFSTFTLSWTPVIDAVNPVLTISVTSNAAPITGYMWFDSFGVYVTAPTIIDRRGFRRTKVLTVSSTLTTAVGNQIGDVYLAAHKTQPLRGQMTVSPGGIRNHASGAEVHPSHLLRSAGQMVRLNHRIDPDTGALGRDGTIASVNYSHDGRASTVAIDSDRRNLEALLARFGALSPA